MFGTSFGAACSYTTDSRGIRETFGSALQSTTRTLVSLGIDGLPATATEVLWFEMFYYGHVATLYITLVAPSKTSCDESLSQLG